MLRLAPAKQPIILLFATNYLINIPSIRICMDIDVNVIFGE